MNKNQVKGTAHKSKGKVKESIGRAVGNEKMERDGKLEHAKGYVQKEAGDVQSSVKKATS